MTSSSKYGSLYIYSKRKILQTWHLCVGWPASPLNAGDATLRLESTAIGDNWREKTLKIYHYDRDNFGRHQTAYAKRWTGCTSNKKYEIIPNYTYLLTILFHFNLLDNFIFVVEMKKTVSWSTFEPFKPLANTKENTRLTCGHVGLLPAMWSFRISHQRSDIDIDQCCHRNLYCSKNDSMSNFASVFAN